MLKPLLAAIIFALTPVATLAQEQEPYDYTGATLRQQQYQIYELNRRLQVQGNQREIQMLQDRVANGGQPPQPTQVIVEQRTNPLVPILGAALIGGAIIYGTNQNNRRHHHHREYHRDGKRYRICRDHHRRYYC
jgi:hypothetical protein